MAGGDLGTLTVGLGLDLKDLRSSVGRAEQILNGLKGNVGQSMKKLGQGFKKVGRSMSTFITAPLVAVGGVSVKAFASFEQAMRNVNVIARQGETQFAATGEQVLAMSAQLGKQPTDLAEALFNINSAGFKGAEAMSVLETSARSAVGGLVSTETAAAGITSVINAFGLSASDATDVADVFFKTNELGVTTFGELAENLGKVNATAAAAGLNFGEVGAAMATITRGGISTTEATTALNAALLKVIKPTTELEKVFAATSLKTGAATLATRGLVGTLELIQKAALGAGIGMKPMEDGLGKLGFGSRDIKAVLSLLRDDMNEFRNDLGAVADQAARAGAAEAAFAENSKTLTFQMARMKAMLTKVGIELGAILAPIVREITKAIQFMAMWFSNLSGTAKTTIVAVAAFAAALGPLAIVVGTLLVTLPGLTIALAGLKAGMIAIAPIMTATILPALGGFLMIILAVTAAVGALAFAYVNIMGDGDNFADRFENMLDKVKKSLSEDLGLDFEVKDEGLTRLENRRASQLKAIEAESKRNNTGLAADLDAAGKAGKGLRGSNFFKGDVFGDTMNISTKGEVKKLADKRVEDFSANIEQTTGAVESGSLEAFRFAKGLDAGSKELRVAQESKKIQEGILEQQSRMGAAILSGNRTIAEAINAITSGEIV